MYNLSIITHYSWSNEFLKNQMEFLFGNLFNITCYSDDEKPIRSIINSDMVLIHEPSAFIKMQEHIKSDCPVILMRRTITSEALYKLKKLPSNKSAVVVNVTEFMALETMLNIYQLGITDLKLVAWSPESEMPFPKTDYILTHRNYDFLPKNNKKTVLLGSRILNADIILDILSYFNVDSKISDSVISRYLSIAPRFLSGSHSLHENNKLLSAQWNLLFDGINFCIAVISYENDIISMNSNFKRLVSDDKSTIHTIDDLVDLIPEFNIINKCETVEDEVIDINSKKYILSTKYLDERSPKLGKMIRLYEYTQIVYEHERVHKKIIGDGHIAKYTFDMILGKDSKMISLKKLAHKFSKSDFSILIYGDSGTGKELLSSAIHNESNRKKGPFIAVNCASIPENLLESEFFGYEGYAFTGARKSGAIGLFEKANGGTLFLDEISELPYSLQGKLLRAVQEKEIRKIGSTQTISVDVRLIAASNKNLEELINKGSFRNDLYYRLNVFSLHIPPLKNRKQDIKLICDNYVKSKKVTVNKSFYEFAEGYDWPGNVRELINVIEYMSVVSEGVLDIEYLPEYIRKKYMSMKLDSESIDLYVLKTILKLKSTGNNSGRKSLSNYISENYFYVSEAEIRKALNRLYEMGYIEIGRGKEGCRLTQKGIIKAEAEEAS